MDAHAAQHPHHPHPRQGAGTRQLALSSGSLLHQVERELRTALEKQVAPLGLTAQQAALLLRAARQATSPNQLAAALGTDTAGMTRLLDRLERKGLVRRHRHPDDRRSVIIEVTEAGQALLPRLGPVFGRVDSQLLAGFSEDETRQLTALLRRLLDNLTRPSPPA